MTKKIDLSDVREKIDNIDFQIQDLLNQRAELAYAVGEMKKQSNEDDVVFYRPEREAQIFRRIKDTNKGPLSNDVMVTIFRQILSACLALQYPTKVAFLGPAGTFSHAAVLKQFGLAIHTVQTDSIKQIFQEVDSQTVDFGLIPFENSTTGIIDITLDMLLQSNLNICGEIDLQVHQCFLTDPKDNTTINAIYSHQQSLRQCKKWIEQHHPSIELIPVSSNAKAAEIAKQKPGAAAIAGEMCAELYGLALQAKNIEDKFENATRFLILGKQQTAPSGEDKSIALFYSAEKENHLSMIMDEFAKQKINVTKILSLPDQHNLWQTVTFVIFDGHQEDAKVKTALQSLNKAAVSYKIIGSYPKEYF